MYIIKEHMDSPSKSFLLSLLLFIAVLISSATGAAGAQGLGLDYHLTISDPASGRAAISLLISNVPGETLKLARLAPYSTNPALEGLSIRVAGGRELNYSYNGPEGTLVEYYTVATGGASSLEVTYAIDLTLDDSQWGQSYFGMTASYGAVESQIMFLQPTTVQAIDHCRLTAQLPQGWRLVTRLNPGQGDWQANLEDRVQLYTQGFPKFPIWGPMGFGPFKSYVKNIGGLEVEIASCGLPEETRSVIADYIFAVLEHRARVIGPMNDPPRCPDPIRYVWVYVDGSDGRLHSGDHIYGQIETLWDKPIEDLKRHDAHTTAHTRFNHYGLTAATTYVDMWMSEGIIQYYAIESLRASGQWSEDRFHQELIAWWQDYGNHIRGTRYDVALYPEANWCDFPNDSLSDTVYTYGIKSVLWYEKIPLVFWLLDQELKARGAAGLDQIWAYFHGNGPTSQLEAISYTEMLNAVKTVTGLDFTGFFSAYFAGNNPLPFYVDGPRLKIDRAQIP